MAWLQPCRGLARGPGPAPGQLSPISIHRPLQMTAWARWSWTSGRTSPSSRIRPASESEPPPRDARRLLPSPPGAFSFLVFFFFPTFYFAFFVCVPIPHLLPPPFQFFPQPSAKLTSAVLTALPPGSRPALTFVTDQDSGASPLPAQDQAFGQWERFRFLINIKPP